MIGKARADPDTARHVLAMFIAPWMTLASFNCERDYLIGIGILAEFLPAGRELGLVAFLAPARRRDPGSGALPPGLQACHGHRVRFGVQGPGQRQRRRRPLPMRA